MDNEWYGDAGTGLSGVGNSYDYGARMYSPRLGRWLSTDPLQDESPSQSPYTAMNDNPLIYIDPDGKRNKYALSWAKTNLFGIPWVDKDDYIPVLDNQGNPIFDKRTLPDGTTVMEPRLRATGWYDQYKKADGTTYSNWDFNPSERPDRLVCYESCFMAYMGSGEKITSYLEKNGFARKGKYFVGRSDAMQWFKKGKKSNNGSISRSFETDIMKGEEGDIVFLGEEAGMEGHAALLLELPKVVTIEVPVVNAATGITESKKMEGVVLKTYSTASGSTYGERAFQFIKVGESWYYIGENQAGQTQNVYQFRGYGQLHNTDNQGDTNLVQPQGEKGSQNR